jgi:hypothetical protein
MKWDVQTRKTGASQTIQGMPAEESVIALALGMPIGQTTMTTMRMEMHLWTVQPSEVARNAALKELAGYNARSKNTMDPTVALQKLFAQMPGLGDQFRKVVTQLTETSGGVMLRMRASVFVPALAQALPQVDPTAPLMEFQSEVTEFSTAALDDSYFAVPAGYQSAPLKDLLKVMLPALPQPQPAAPQPQ